jgi:hypothetical protein
MDVVSDFCRSCTAPVMWLTNEKTGKRAPIDAEPAPDGNIVVFDALSYQVIGGTERQDAIDEGFPLHLNHYVTCPQAAAWKARAAKAAAT